MAYSINFTDNSKPPLVIEDNQVNTSKSIDFIGKNYPGYGQIIAESFLHLLENFSSNIQPSPTESVTGQLWYDAVNSQLKVFDGQTYGPAGNIFKSFTAPVNKKVGDLWVDLTNKQLFFWSGVDWVLIGPQFSQGSNSGPVIEAIKDTLNVDRIIIRLVVSGETIIILCKERFVPKLTIDGFVELYPGVNLSSKTFVTGITNKLWGTAEKATALQIGNSTIDASKFLRSDTSGSTDYKFTIRSDEGLSLGSNNNISLTSNSNGELVVYNNTDGASITFKTFINPSSINLLTLKGNKVGVNNVAPLETLDVVGSGKFTDNVKVLGTTDLGTNTTVSNLSGALQVAGGLSLAKKLFVGSDATLNGITTSKTIIPVSDGTYNLGDTNKAYNRVYADIVGNNAGTTQFYGNFSGVYTGSISGSASQLANTTTFTVTGDVKTVTGGEVQFNGAVGGTNKIFNVELDPNLLDNKTLVTSVTEKGSDTFLLIQDNAVRKTTRTQLFAKVATVPVGTILPFAGINPPNGYLLCDGAEVLRSNFPELYNIIGGTYNVGVLQGVGTFQLPDLRGRFALGRDTMYNGIQVPLSSTSLTGFAGNIQNSNSSDTTTIISNLNSLTGLAVGQLLSKVSGTGDFGGITTIVSIDIPNSSITINCASPYTVGTINFTSTTSTSFVATPNIVNRVTNSNADTVGGSGGSEALASVLGGTIITGGITVGANGTTTNVMNPFLTINYIIFTGRYSA